MPKHVPTPTERIRAFLLAWTDQPNRITKTGDHELLADDLVSLLAEVEDDTPLGDVSEVDDGRIAVHIPAGLEDDGGPYFDKAKASPSACSATTTSCSTPPRSTRPTVAAATPPRSSGASPRTSTSSSAGSSATQRSSCSSSTTGSSPTVDSMTEADQARKRLLAVARFKALRDGIQFAALTHQRTEADAKTRMRAVLDDPTGNLYAKDRQQFLADLAALVAPTPTPPPPTRRPDPATCSGLDRTVNDDEARPVSQAQWKALALGGASR